MDRPPMNGAVELFQRMMVDTRNLSKTMAIHGFVVPKGGYANMHVKQQDDYDYCGPTLYEIRKNRDAPLY